MEEKDWTERNDKTKKTLMEKYGVTNYLNLPEVKEKHKRVCPFGCRNNHRFDAGNFSNHMIKLHDWDKDKIKEFKRDNCQTL